MAGISEQELKKVERARTDEEAKALALEFLTKMNDAKTPMKPEKVSYLTRMITGARDKTQVLGIVFNAYLSGEGLAVVGSGYQRKFK